MSTFLGPRGLTLVVNSIFWIPNTLLTMGYLHRFSSLTDLYRKYGGEYQRNPSQAIFEASKRTQNRLNLSRAVIGLAFTSMIFQFVTYILLVGGAIIAAEVLFGIALFLFLLGMILAISELAMQQRNELDQLNSMRAGLAAGTQQPQPHVLTAGQPVPMFKGDVPQAGAGIDRPASSSTSAGVGVPTYSTGR